MNRHNREIDMELFSPNGKVFLTTCTSINAVVQQTLLAKLTVSRRAKGIAALSRT